MIRPTKWLGDLSRLALGGAALGVLLAGLLAGAGYRTVSDSLVLASVAAATLAVLLGLVSLVGEPDPAVRPSSDTDLNSCAPPPPTTLESLPS